MTELDLEAPWLARLQAAPADLDLLARMPRSMQMVRDLVEMVRRTVELKAPQHTAASLQKMAASCCPP